MSEKFHEEEGANGEEDEGNEEEEQAIPKSESKIENGEEEEEEEEEEEVIDNNEISSSPSKKNSQRSNRGSYPKERTKIHAQNTDNGFTRQIIGAASTEGFVVSGAIKEKYSPSKSSKYPESSTSTIYRPIKIIPPQESDQYNKALVECRICKKKVVMEMLPYHEHLCTKHQPDGAPGHNSRYKVPYPFFETHSKKE